MYPGNNPYAPPQASVVEAVYGPGPYAPPARVEGKLLVAPNGSPFPGMCLKCGGQPTHLREQKYRYTPPWAMMMGWLGILIFSKRSSFRIPLCERDRVAWKKWNLIAALSCLPGVAFWVLGAVVVNADGDVGAVLFLVGTLVFFAGLITALLVRARKTVYPSKIDKTHTWLRGVHPSVLQVVSGAQSPQSPESYGQAPQGYGGQSPCQGYPR